MPNVVCYVDLLLSVNCNNDNCNCHSKLINHLTSAALMVREIGIEPINNNKNNNNNNNNKPTTRHSYM